jgi:hypothetical protein
LHRVVGEQAERSRDAVGVAILSDETREPDRYAMSKSSRSITAKLMSTVLSGKKYCSIDAETFTRRRRGGANGRGTRLPPASVRSLRWGAR